MQQQRGLLLQLGQAGATGHAGAATKLEQHLALSVVPRVSLQM
jgi:hypothetical protein